MGLTRADSSAMPLASKQTAPPLLLVPVAAGTGDEVVGKAHLVLRRLAWG